MKIMPQSAAKSPAFLHAPPPISLRVFPFDKVRFQYARSGMRLAFKCFWMLNAIESPMEPRPIHPNWRVSFLGNLSDSLTLIVVHMTKTCKVFKEVCCAVRCKACILAEVFVVSHSYWMPHRAREDKAGTYRQFR